LTPDYLDVLPDSIMPLYDEFSQSVINDIARRLAKMPMTPTAAWQAKRLIESGQVYEDVIKQVAKLTGRSEKELTELFKKAGVRSIRFDDSIYKAAGLSPLPLNLSPAMAQVLAAGLRKTNGLMNNLVLTTALTSQQAFISASDLAYLQVTSGAFSYDEAIRAAIKKVASEGLYVVYPSGKKDLLDVAMRRAVLTGVSQTASKLQEARADEVGQDLVQTSAHGGARPSHALWQGKIFSRSGADPDYPSFVPETGYGTGAGLGGWNCRHSWYPFFKGISRNAYEKATVDEMNAKTVTLNGKEIPMYEATQIQRSIERKIRAWKREAGALSAAGKDNTFELMKVKEWQARMRAFVKETGLQRQNVREQVVQ
jgi:hypothetical protein